MTVRIVGTGYGLVFSPDANTALARHNWTNNGLLACSIYAMGLHHGTSEVPFAKSQLERRAYHLAFALDKQVATSKGRPPLLSHRWDQCPLPFELSDEELMLEGPGLEAALSSLKTSGWSKQERYLPVSYLRALAIMSTFREEVLELSFGRQDPSLESSQMYGVAIHCISYVLTLRQGYQESFVPSIQRAAHTSEI